MSLKQHLQEDEADERGDVRKYGERQEEAREHPAMRSMLKGIQQDERKHAKRISATHKRLKPRQASADRKPRR